MTTVRKPAVAFQFYEGDPARLREDLRNLIGSVEDARPAAAVVAPHAGYVYSGAVAGAAYARVQVPETVVIFGPNHTGFGAPAALMDSGTWIMPFGPVPIEESLAAEILRGSRYLEADIQAHLFEHSLEVQVPFLQYRQPSLRIVPICLGPLPYEMCRDIGGAVASAVKDFSAPVLLVASTDMTHYEPQARAAAKDKRAIERVLALDAAGLLDTVRQEGISMCGVVPTTVAIEAAKALGAATCQLVRYATSGDVSGDYDRVVGYASFILQ